MVKIKKIKLPILEAMQHLKKHKLKPVKPAYVKYKKFVIEVK